MIPLAASAMFGLGGGASRFFTPEQTTSRTAVAVRAVVLSERDRQDEDSNFFLGSAEQSREDENGLHSLPDHPAAAPSALSLAATFQSIHRDIENRTPRIINPSSIYSPLRGPPATC